MYAMIRVYTTHTCVKLTLSASFQRGSIPIRCFRTHIYFVLQVLGDRLCLLQIFLHENRKHLYLCFGRDQPLPFKNKVYTMKIQFLRLNIKLSKKKECILTLVF